MLKPMSINKLVSQQERSTSDIAIRTLSKDPPGKEQPASKYASASTGYRGPYTSHQRSDAAKTADSERWRDSRRWIWHKSQTSTLREQLASNPTAWGMTTGPTHRNHPDICSPNRKTNNSTIVQIEVWRVIVFVRIQRKKTGKMEQ